MAKTSELYHQLTANLNHPPTDDQTTLMTKLVELASGTSLAQVLVINGYAGTGKTSMMGAYVKTMMQNKMKFMLMAPTGRAAKVLATFTGRPAYTIHKVIYQPVTEHGQTYFQLVENPYRKVQFIVDEASMISDEKIPGKNFEMRSVLEDLLQFVFSDPDSSLIFIGDTAQLPPVGSDESPALNASFLQDKFSLKVQTVQLKEVVRQSSTSGILHNATELRKQLNQKTFSYPRLTSDFSDCQRVQGYTLQEELESAVGTRGIEHVVFLCRSNKRANLFNQEIRNRVLGMEDELCQNDLMMVVRNNYFWLKNNKYADFIANGDVIRIERVRGVEDKYGFRFADVRISIKDYTGNPELEVKLMLDCIHSETPSLDQAEYKKLYYEVAASYEHLRDRNKIREKVLKDPYFNALQVKFAYAVTCHKAQGGQWEAVFVDQGFITEDTLDRNFYRWLYTAITRATDQLFFVNFSPEFFGEGDDF
jgi:exodeoxyribonuclease V